jgi:hypothetical protein
MILAGGHAGADERARFLTEAEAVARLQHPGIVQIYEVGEHRGLPFFSLEFCPGGSLAQKLAGTPLPRRHAGCVSVPERVSPSRSRVMARARKVRGRFANTGSEQVPPGATRKAADTRGNPTEAGGPPTGGPPRKRSAEEGARVRRLAGFDAIEFARRQGLTLNKHPDAAQGPREGLTVAEAEAIASEDPALIWLDVDEDDSFQNATNFEPER